MFSGLGGLGALGGGGTNDIAVRIGLTGAKKFEGDLNATATKMGGFATMAAKALVAIGVAAAVTFAMAVKEASHFEHEMANVNTLLDVSDEQFAKLNDGVLGLARTLPVSMDSMTKGLYDLVSAGVAAGDSIGALELAGMAATAGMTSVDVAVRAGMSTINAYGLEMTELERIYDLQFSTVKYGVLTYEELSNALGNVLPAASNLKVPLTDLYGAIAHITKNGIVAQKATTFLARAFESMTENRGAWKDMGAAIFDTSGEFRGLLPIMADMNRALAGMSTETKITKLELLGMEKRAAKAILPMINNYQALAKSMGNVEASTGAMRAAQQKVLDTFEEQVKLIKNQLKVVFIEMGRDVVPILTESLKAMSEILLSITPILTETIGTVGTAVLLFKSGPLNNALNSLLYFGEMAKKSNENLAKLKREVGEVGERWKDWDTTGISKLTADVLGLTGGVEKLGDETEETVKPMAHLDKLLKENAKAAELYAAEIKVIEDNSVQTTAAMKAKIAEIERLIPLLERHAPQATSKFTKELKDLQIIVGRSENDGLIGSWGMLGDTGSETTAQIKKSTKATDDLVAAQRALGDIFSNIVEVLDEVGGAAGLLGSVLAEVSVETTTLEDGTKEVALALDPLTAIVAAVDWGMGQWSDTLDQIEADIQAVIDKTWDMIHAQRDLILAGAEVSEGYGNTSAMMDDLSAAMDQLEHRFDDTNLSMNDAVETLERMEEVAAEMTRLTEAWAFLDDFNKLTAGLDDLIAFGKYMDDLFGQGGWPGYDAYIEQLEEQIRLNIELLGTLDPLSAAYAQVWAAIDRALTALGQKIPFLVGYLLNLQAAFREAMGREVTTLGDFTEGKGLRDLTDEMNRGSGAAAKFRNEWLKLSSELMGGFNFMEEGMADLNTFIDEMEYMGEPLENVGDQINKAMSEWQAYINTLKPGSQAFKDATAAMDETMTRLSDLGYQVTIDPNAIWSGPPSDGSGGWGGLGDLDDIEIDIKVRGDIEEIEESLDTIADLIEKINGITTIELILDNDDYHKTRKMLLDIKGLLWDIGRKSAIEMDYSQVSEAHQEALRLKRALSSTSGNNTGSSLLGEIPINITVIIKDPSPTTTVEIVDDQQDRQNDLDRNQSSKGGPF